MDAPGLDAEVLARARAAYALPEVVVSPGARGALGQVWRLEADERRWALKHVLAGIPPSPEEIAAEVALTRAAARAGVRLPLSHPALTGAHLVPLPDGGWLRLHDWVDLCPADLAADPESVGVLLARLHRCAPAVDRETDGSPSDRWYVDPPGLDGWTALVAEAARAGAPWAGRLAAAVDQLPELHDLLAEPAPDAMLLCHRDLHPENVQADPDGELVVVDWDALGPADAARELLAALVACFHDGEPDLDAIRRAHAAYVEEGGPARVTSTADATMLLAADLNFLRKMVRVALDPTALPREREWAEAEVSESLRLLPDRRLLGDVVEVLRGP